MGGRVEMNQVFDPIGKDRKERGSQKLFEVSINNALKEPKYEAAAAVIVGAIMLLSLILFYFFFCKS